MSNQRSTPPGAGQPSLSPKARAIQDWLIATDKALEALRWWRATLTVWLNHPHVTDEAFMQAVQNLAEAGLLEFLDGCPANIDHLRALVTEEV